MTVPVKTRLPVEPLPRPAVMPDWASMVRSPHQMLALSFGLGLSRVAPGTAGAIGGFALYAALFQISPGLRAVVYIALIILASIASSRTGADLGKHDHNSIVIDETLGMSLTLEAAPLSWEAWIAAFFLFRLFDIWKPWPVNVPDRSGTSGFAVIADDILAAGYAAAVLLAAVYFGVL